MSIYDTLNPQQKEAVFCTEGPLLLLAGAGSGKTRVLVHRIVYLIEEKGINPWNILAITFTNKAAGEMRERVDDMLGYGSDSVWVSTFHSACVRILRRHIDKLGYGNNFSIYDSDDQKKVIKEVYKRLKIDSKQLPEKAAINSIAKAKEQYQTSDEYKSEAMGNYREEQIARIYIEYQKQLKNSNALDFDDLIMKTVELFERFPEILKIWQDRFRYIMVDEYQDTNRVQFLLLKKLSERYRNLCVVGDDDQSVYGFRGADIRNILDFENVYPDTRIIKLEQNYRSTKCILEAANGVIHHNYGRKDKTLWTENEEGDKVSFIQYQDNYEEANGIAGIIEELVSAGLKYKDIAILNRTNAQSRVYEEKLMIRNIPYKIIGGVNFYARMEIKDVLAYLKLLDNPLDDQAVKRIINVPRRGIGQTTIGRIQNYALIRGIGFMDAIDMVEDIPDISGAAKKKVSAFSDLINELRVCAQNEDLCTLFDCVVNDTGYSDALALEGTEEAKERLENLEELKNKIAAYMEENEHATLAGLLEEIALIADIDSMTGDDAVLIMTIHSAKGLEFPCVFMGGMEDGVFPGYRSISSVDEDELEEERRLCYVGITRARQVLYLSAAKRRMMNGQTQYNRVSRFVHEIPPLVLQSEVEEDTFSSGSAINFLPSYQLKSKDSNTAFGRTEHMSFGTQSSVLDYEEGDRVRHIKFGVGRVQEIISAGADYEVAVLFEKYGIKRMFASFAQLKKEE